MGIESLDCSVSRGRERIWTMIGLALGLIYHIATFPYPIGATLKWKPAGEFF